MYQDYKGRMDKNMETVLGLGTLPLEPNGTDNER